MVVIDLYSFKGLKLLTSDISSSQNRKAIHLFFWVVSVLFWLSIPIIYFNIESFTKPENNSWVFLVNSVILLMVVSKLTFVFFHGLDDLFHGVRKALQGFFQFSGGASSAGEQITRAKFLTYVGAGFFALSFGTISYGILKGRFNFRIKREKLHFPNLPKSFDGLKVVQISDAHMGSFPKFHSSVEKAVEMINQLEPDVILFTGDFVNNVAEELEGWQPVFSKLQAKHGKFSILGNHDYGDYYRWNSMREKEHNMQRLQQIQKEMGFDLLLNENRTLEIDGEQIALIGVENWGKPPFVQYGDLARAKQGTEDKPFSILLSHDPSHWDEEVIKSTSIDLTLSGHTHGMQFGIEIPGFKWSPVKFKYPRWAGLYQESNQYLYVNRGFGHIGFAGRVGMPPEITLLELSSQA